MTQSDVVEAIRDAIDELPEEKRAAILVCIGRLEMLRSEVGDVAFLIAIAFVGAKEAAK